MLVFTPKQVLARKLLQKDQTHTMLVGGSRSGKTLVLVNQILVRAIKTPESRHAIFRLHGNAANASIAQDTLPLVAKWRGLEWGMENVLKYQHNKGYFEVPSNGSEIWVSGLDDKERVEKVLGMQFATILLNECSQIPYTSAEMAVTRLAQKVSDVNGNYLKPRAYYDLNPTSTGHWTYKLFILGLDPKTNKPLTQAQVQDHAWMRMNPDDNKDNLPEGYIENTLMGLSERQRLRFYSGEYCPEVDGALWTLENLEAGRLVEAPLLQRIIVAVDPSGHTGEENSHSDAIGIVVAGKDYDNHVHVLEDLTCTLSPEGWARLVVETFKKYHADLIVAEGNFGGDMVRATIRGADPYVPVKLVTASRGKQQRAEPIAALYEPTPGVTGERIIRVHHIGSQSKFAELETELMLFSTSGYKGAKSPNRADACIWAITELMLTGVSNSWDHQPLRI